MFSSGEEKRVQAFLTALKVQADRQYDTLKEF